MAFTSHMPQTVDLRQTVDRPSIDRTSSVADSRLMVNSDLQNIDDKLEATFRQHRNPEGKCGTGFNITGFGGQKQNRKTTSNLINVTEAIYLRYIDGFVE